MCLKSAAFTHWSSNSGPVTTATTTTTFMASLALLLVVWICNFSTANFRILECVTFILPFPNTTMTPFLMSQSVAVISVCCSGVASSAQPALGSPDVNSNSQI